MSETKHIDTFDKSLSRMNNLLGFAGNVLPEYNRLPSTLDASSIWQTIANSEKDYQRCPLEIECYWGVDFIHGTLTCTEVTKGEERTVEPKEKHFIDIHSERWRNGLFRERRPGLTPYEIVSLLSNDDTYINFVFTRGKDKKYPCCLVVKSKEASHVAYDEGQAWTEIQMIKFAVSGYHRWNREPHILQLTDKLAKEKKLGIYRGIVCPNNEFQGLLERV